METYYKLPKEIFYKNKQKFDRCVFWRFSKDKKSIWIKFEMNCSHLIDFVLLNNTQMTFNEEEVI